MEDNITIRYDYIPWRILLLIVISDSNVVNYLMKLWEDQMLEETKKELN